MSNVSIFEKKWIDLVFEGKNKEYGAYQLRQESPRTTLAAFFFGIVFIGFISGIGLFLSSFGNHPSLITTTCPNDTTVIVVNVEPPVTEPEIEPIKPNPYTAVETVTDNQHYIVAPTPEANPDVAKNPENPSNGNPTGGTGEPSTGGEPGPAIVAPIIPEVEPPTGPVNPGLLDTQPQYPGGMKKFYEYVGNNFEKPEIEDVETVSVNVSFVIEKDGSMTDIKVLRNPGYGLDKEAIRVLKSLKTKWSPGIKDGKKVRTQYTLPIKIQMS
jgi:periplasmic protein TonB